MPDVQLSPAQTTARELLARAVPISPVLHLWAETGRGKTTVLRHLHEEIGGEFLSIEDILNPMLEQHPLSVEERLFETVRKSMKHHQTVILDDLETVNNTFCCNHMYPRQRWLEAPALALCDDAAKSGRTLIFSHGGMSPHAMQERGIGATIPRFQVQDYETLVRTWLGERGSTLDFAKIYRFAPKLNGHQLRAACEWLAHTSDGAIDTEAFIEYLRSQRLASNVDLEEVQKVDLKDLIGVDDVLRALEIHIAVPLENDRLASELNLRPKRGVLLYGPPGTGKTTVGRALAHRLRGKFFLIDGTFIAGTGEFYQRVHQVFEAAKENAPAVIFIDDADAIFEGGEEQGLYRYLLTMLDGLESESAGRVCVMMTAMEVGHLPLALVRSGRVELWLEMKLPDGSARQAILEQNLAKAGPRFAVGEFDELIAATERFTGADLKRVVEDAKSLYAFDVATGAEARSAEALLLQAIEGVTDNKRRYEQAEAGARTRGGGMHHAGVPMHFVTPANLGAFWNGPQEE